MLPTYHLQTGNQKQPGGVSQKYQVPCDAGVRFPKMPVGLMMPDAAMYTGWLG